MAFIQKHLFSVSRPHQRGWIGGNQESICRSPQEPTAKPCLTKRQFAKRVKQLWAFQRLILMDISRSGCAGGLFSPPTSDCSNALTLSWAPQSAIQTEPCAQNTLKLVKTAYLARAARPPHRMFHRSATAKTGRMQRAVGTRRRGVAGIGRRKKPRPQKLEGHIWSIPRWAKTADSLEQLSSLNLRASVRKSRRFFLQNEGIGDQFCSCKAEQLSYLHFIYCLCYLLARLHRNPT